MEAGTSSDRRPARLALQSDMTDAEWALIEPLIPPEKRPGRHREVNIREVVNAIFYLLSTGCQWRALPKDLPPRSTVHDYFKLWDWDGTLERIHFALFVQVREGGKRSKPHRRDHRQPERQGRGKAAGLRSIRSAMTRERRSKAVKRHILVDTLGMLLIGQSTPPVSRTGMARCRFSPRPAVSFLHRRIFADGGYQGEATATAVALIGRWELEIVKRLRTAKGFVVLPKRWIVERTFGWLGRCRRLGTRLRALRS